MGVCGCGKSTVGQAVADSCSIAFEDADDYHPQSNVDKMRSGTPLNDEDRAPWYEILRNRLKKARDESKPIVLACSALKEKYRQQMAFEGCRHQFVYLKGDYDTLNSRLSKRQGHFMSNSLLDSQLETLEVPSNAITVDIRQSVPEILSQIRAAIT